MSPVPVEEFLMIVEKGITQSVDDALPVLLTDPKDPEGFRPLLYLNRTLSHDQWNDLHLHPRSVTRFQRPVRMGVSYPRPSICPESRTPWAPVSIVRLKSRRIIFFIFLFITQPSGLLRQKDFSTSSSSVMDESVLFP
jgi:hypothetical protein